MKDLEYEINKGELEDFKLDIKDYHLKRIKCKSPKSIEYADRLMKELKEKYSLSYEKFHKNYQTHIKIICNRYK